MLTKYLRKPIQTKSTFRLIRPKAENGNLKFKSRRHKPSSPSVFFQAQRTTLNYFEPFPIVSVLPIKVKYLGIINTEAEK